MKLGIREETLFSSQVKQLCCELGVFLLDLHPICVIRNSSLRELIILAVIAI